MKISLTLFLLLSVFLASAQQIAAIDTIVTCEMEAKKIPAIAISVIKDGKIIHLKSYGYSDLENKTLATVDTPFEVASVSKTVINLAVFKLVELGKIDLDKDVNHYLPFKVKNPYMPKDKITVKELLNHKSGIIDNYKILDTDNNDSNGDSAIELSNYLESYFSKNGKLYSNANFADTKEYRYANVTYALLGLVVEKISGTSLENFCNNNIFKPLEMNNTSWFLKNLTISTVAKTYTINKDNQLEFLGFNGFPIYPSGQLRTSIRDYSNLLQHYLISKDETFILSKSLVSTITPDPGFSREGWYTWNKVALIAAYIMPTKVPIKGSKQ